ncbi:class I SAM-dependent DNA methyltransferase [Streptomyces noursei]|uniref:Methyltransferase n=1 Tax=Streptomyces noursei TaxID=1971 RepID=A0A2N8PJ16_STRNR|nr:class I SAM-dependent methyltransferase [Streptomyces noursei]PNE41006.1 methyltransferase [Streptomyces noursei]
MTVSDATSPPEPSFLRSVRTAYDTVAVDYERLLRTALAEMPMDRAMLGAFADLVRADGAGPVADLGCGPGRITSHLHALGLDVFGVDLSPEMVAVARRAHPEIRFEEGSMTGLDLADGLLAGVVAWYSIIHTPPERLPAVFEEFHRVLAPGGHLLLAFKAGDELRHLDHAYGHDLSLDVYWLAPDRVAELAGRAGFAVGTRVHREPEGHENGPQAYLLARKPAE